MRNIRLAGWLPFLLFFCCFLLSAEAGAQETGGGDTSKIRRPAVDSTQRGGSPQSGSGGTGQYQSPSTPSSLEFLRQTIRRDSALLRAYLDSIANTPLARMRRNLAMHPSEWMPTAADKRRRDDEIKSSQSWDMMYDDIPRVGFSTPLQAIARALGLIEDVTPRISYTLTRTDSVSVRVYDLTAQVVQVIVSGAQSPGVYSFDWDMRDNEGRRVVAGDYIAEVIVNNRLALRKRIEVP